MIFAAVYIMLSGNVTQQNLDAPLVNKYSMQHYDYTGSNKGDPRKPVANYENGIFPSPDSLPDSIPTVSINPLKGRGVNWLHFAI